jgi:hypothetical protein
MQRKLAIVIGILAIALAVALVAVLMRGPSARPAPISIDAADENKAEPLHQEMGCIDRLLQNNDLDANEVGPALARCKDGSTGNLSNGP